MRSESARAMHYFGSLKQIGEYIYLTFPIRRLLLICLVVLSIVPGAFLFSIPLSFRFLYAYVFVGITEVSVFCTLGIFKGPVVMMIGSIISRKQVFLQEYRPPEVIRLIRKMGIKKQVKIFITNNKWVPGPFTNALTSKIYIPLSWMAKFPPEEILATIAHELGHVKKSRRFGFETIASLGGILLGSILLRFLTLPIIVEIFEFAAVMLAITYLSWNNERRADTIGAMAVGPEGLISVFEQLRTEQKHDDGSETHPPLRDRIARLSRLLDFPAHDFQG